ncbi:hypothetical protein FPQ18DRAFT_104531 [Pyronema domesticum]|nr:hypothetical protein FPQ18DRAFT_104531 [Pyronema domesticum]
MPTRHLLRRIWFVVTCIPGVDQVPNPELRKDDGCCVKVPRYPQLGMSDVRFGAESVGVNGMEILLRRMEIVCCCASCHLVLFVVHLISCEQ